MKTESRQHLAPPGWSRRRAPSLWLPWLVGLGLLMGCPSRCGSSPGGGTGGSGEPTSSQEPHARACGEGALEVLGVSVGGSGGETSRTSFLTLDPITVRGRVRDCQELDEHIRWTLKPLGPQTADADPVTHQGSKGVFRTFSRVGTAGSRQPNPPLEYELSASVPSQDEEGASLRLPPPLRLRQDEPDVLRQEYIDYGTRFRPTRQQISLPARRSLNTGNYQLIAEQEKGGLERLLTQMQQRVDALLNGDLQRTPVGTRGLAPTAVVVSPGEAILVVGSLSNTDPEGDDVCAGPRPGGRCNGPILAGPDGIAQTHANNRAAHLELEDLVSSAFRNPQRNRAAGSASVNSRHTLGSALDLDPRLASVPGRSLPQLMCLLEAAGDSVVGPNNAFTEHGATTFLACDSPAADHVHVQR